MGAEGVVGAAADVAAAAVGVVVLVEVETGAELRLIGMEG